MSYVKSILTNDRTTVLNYVIDGGGSQEVQIMTLMTYYTSFLVQLTLHGLFDRPFSVAWVAVSTG